mmetsp:Transcript_18179/g.18229  ORF Transcript_18179/g.18229 Transcript_18179/m.18229 type:complete len:108 (+) Transcript_18179:101-424(+)
MLGCHRLIQGVRLISNNYAGRRMLLSSTSDFSLERKIHDTLKSNLKPTKLDVVDTSGGCGAMFNITIESSLFKGMPLVKQHKLVTKTIAEEIEQLHGLTLKTKASPE